jgi:hypothetical protein
MFGNVCVILLPTAPMASPNMNVLDVPSITFASFVSVRRPNHYARQGVEKRIAEAPINNRALLECR